MPNLDLRGGVKPLPKIPEFMRHGQIGPTPTKPPFLVNFILRGLEIPGIASPRDRSLRTPLDLRTVLKLLKIHFDYPMWVDQHGRISRRRTHPPSTVKLFPEPEKRVNLMFDFGITETILSALALPERPIDGQVPELRPRIRNGTWGLWVTDPTRAFWRDRIISYNGSFVLQSAVQ